MMNEIKLVHGTPGNRKFATPARQRELINSAPRTKGEWLEVNENEPITKSDVAMSIGVYVAMPIMAITSVVTAFNV